MGTRAIKDTDGSDESFSVIEGEDPTAEGWKPQWLREQEAATQVPVNVYAEVTAANFADTTDAVFSANVAPEAPDETPADATE